MIRIYCTCIGNGKVQTLKNQKIIEIVYLGEHRRKLENKNQEKMLTSLT